MKDAFTALGLIILLNIVCVHEESSKGGFLRFSQKLTRKEAHSSSISASKGQSILWLSHVSS